MKIFLMQVVPNEYEFPEWVDDLSDQLSNAGDQLLELGIGAAQLLGGLLIAIFLSKWVRKVIRKRTRNTPSPTIAVMAENTASAAVYIITFTIVLTFWGLTWSSLITALSISTVAVAFGFQDLLRSFVGGMLIVFEHPFSVGDRIKLRDIEGRVERIYLRTTVVRGDNNDRITVPNALILSDPIVNRSPNRVIRMVNVSGIDGSPAEVKKQVIDTLAAIPGIDSNPKLTIRTRQNISRVRRAVEAMPMIDLGVNEDEKQQGPRAIGFKLIWSGDGTAATRTEVKHRLQLIFPSGRISDVNW